MKGYIDLQIQTIFSDGDLSPRHVVRLAKRYGVLTIAITDHDSVAGIDEAKKEGERVGVSVVNGIELYSSFQKRELHILGYDINPRNPRLTRFLAIIQRRHRDWLVEVCEKLRKKGWIVRTARLLASPSQLVSFREIFQEIEAHQKNRLHLLADFGTKTPDLFDWINRYFGKGGIAHVPLPEKQVPTRTAIQLIRAARGKAVLAHPGQQLQFADDRVVAALKTMGLRGIEAITPHHTWQQVLHYQWLAKKLGLFVTAGSDFHELLDSSIHTQTRWDYFRVHFDRLPWQKH